MAEKVRDYPRLAKDIVRLVGGDPNIAAVSRALASVTDALTSALLDHTTRTQPTEDVRHI